MVCPFYRFLLPDPTREALRIFLRVIILNGFFGKNVPDLDFFVGWNFYFAIPKITSSSKCMRTYYARTRTWPMLWQSQKPKKFQQKIMLSRNFTPSTAHRNDISLWKSSLVCDPYPKRVKVKLQESFQLSTFIVITPSRVLQIWRCPENKKSLQFCFSFCFLLKN